MLLQRTPMLRGLPMLRGSPPMLLLPPRKTLKNAFMEVGGGEEGDEGGRSRAEMRRAWTVGQATSISEVYPISV